MQLGCCGVCFALRELCCIALFVNAYSLWWPAGLCGCHASLCVWRLSQPRWCRHVLKVDVLPSDNMRAAQACHHPAPCNKQAAQQKPPEVPHVTFPLASVAVIAPSWGAHTPAHNKPQTTLLGSKSASQQHSHSHPSPSLLLHTAVGSSWTITLQQHRPTMTKSREAHDTSMLRRQLKREVCVCALSTVCELCMHVCMCVVGGRGGEKRVCGLGVGLAALLQYRPGNGQTSSTQHAAHNTTNV